MSLANLSVIQVLSLGSPGIAFVFAVSFLGISRAHRQTHNLRFEAFAFALFGCGAAIQILFFPADPNLNALVSGACYVVCTLALTHGFLKRVGKSLVIYTVAAAFLIILGGLWYYSYVDPNLPMRVYILNFGCALVLLRACASLGALRRGKGIDQWLFWALLVFAFSFFPRTWFTYRPSIAVPTDFTSSAFWIALNLSMVLFATFLGVLLIIAAMTDRIEHLDHERNHDPLTGVLNRRGLEVFVASDGRRTTDELLSIVAIDLDHFKSVNDQFGHRAGDTVLVQLTELVRTTLRRQDGVARVGGEEFIVVLPGTDSASAIRYAERLRAEIEQHPFRGLPASHRVTASLGVATRHDGELFFKVLERADAQLYKAKAAGRNCVFYDIRPSPRLEAVA